MVIIMELALVGNCAYQALIDHNARVVWLCWPRFDSSFVFGRLLDTDNGGEFAITPVAPVRSITQGYVPNTNILRTVFTTEDGSFEVTDFAPRFWQYERMYRPTMLMRRIRPIQGSPRIRVRVNPRYDYGRECPAATAASNHLQWNMHGEALRLTSNVPLTYIQSESAFALDQDRHFALTWGAPLEAPLEETFTSFLSRTERYWQTWVKHMNIPGVFQKEVIRSALALKLHQYDDTGAITAAATTSLPEEHGAGRNWDYRFCWLRDSYFTLLAMRRLGHFEELEGFVAFLKNLVANHPERLQPVFGVGGEYLLTESELPHLAGYHDNQPVRIGNAAYTQLQNDVYGEMLGALAPLILDVRFHHNERATQEAIDLLRSLLARIRVTLNEPDAGLWEYRGAARVHTFSLLMHWMGARVARRVARHIGDAELETHATELMSAARTLIETQCFDPANGYYVDSTTTRNPDASLFLMVHLGYFGKDLARARNHVHGLAKELRQDNGLVQRYRHEDDFGTSTSTFTVCGFWYAEALARIGELTEAKEICAALLRHSNHVGLFSEDIDPLTGEQLGNFPQTYSHVGLINTAFAICISPDAADDQDL
jgi:GH15 family glucan-1,4-alpha-glucosidase